LSSQKSNGILSLNIVKVKPRKLLVVQHQCNAQEKLTNCSFFLTFGLHRSTHLKQACIGMVSGTSAMLEISRSSNSRIIEQIAAGKAQTSEKFSQMMYAIRNY